MPVPDPPSEHGGEPTFSASSQAAIDAMKPGVFSPRRLPDFYSYDFLNGLDWTCYAGTATITTGAVSHPGVVRLTTGASSGDTAIIGLHDAVDKKPLWADNVVTNLCAFKLSSVSGTRINIGLYGDSLSTDRFGNNSISFELDTDVNGVLALRSDLSGTPTRLESTTTASSGVWYKLDWYRNTTGLEFYVNNVLIGTLTSNVASGSCGIGITLKNLAAASRYADIDLYQYEHYISQRFD